MFKRLKQALVESFVGAIALGWLLAQSLSHFAATFTSPLAALAMQKQMQAFQSSSPRWENAALQRAILELVTAVSLFALSYILLRWLYYKPVQEQLIERTSNSEGAS